MHPTKKGKWVLWHSPVIVHSTRSQEVYPIHDQGGGDGGLSNPVRYRNMVSLRECFLYFIQLTLTGHTAMNTMPDKSWVGGADFKFDPHDCLSDGPEDSKLSARKKMSSTDQPQHQDQQSSSAAGLEHHASSLTLDDRQPSSHREIAWRRGESLTVYFSHREQRWYYVDKKGKRLHVTLYKEQQPDGSYVHYFIDGNRRQRVKLDKGKGRAYH